jgi:hypothetical protein
MRESTLEQTLAAAASEHLVPGREIHWQNLQGSQFREVCLITETGDGIEIANIWSTIGAGRPEPGALDALDADAIARANGARQAIVGPLRTCLFDRLDVGQAGDERDFGGITVSWMGAVDAPAMTQVTADHGFHSAYIYRNGTITFAKGGQAYVLDAPDGEVFIMESYTRHRDAVLSEGNLARLGGQLAFPSGWGFRAEPLVQDIEVSSAHHGNLAHVVQDNLHNSYQGSDVARAFTEFCERDSLW